MTQVFHDLEGLSFASPQWARVIDETKAALAQAGVICLPTDTVYGIGADPLNEQGVTNLLAAKSRTRAMPPPVLVANVAQARALVSEATLEGAMGEALRVLAKEFWPGALTIIVPANEHIGWDLGETNGTVGLRMPDHAVALALLEETGPLAVTSANKTGQPPAQDISEAQDQLGEAISVYLDAGAAPGGVPSTIVRLTELSDKQTVGAEFLRVGAIDPDEIVAAANLHRLGD